MIRNISPSRLRRWLAAHRPELEPRMCFMTGGAVSEEAQALVDAHPERVLAKPFDSTQLAAFVAARLVD